MFEKKDLSQYVDNEVIVSSSLAPATKKIESEMVRSFFVLDGTNKFAIMENVRSILFRI